MLKTPNWHIAEEGATAIISIIILFSTIGLLMISDYFFESIISVNALKVTLIVWSISIYTINYFYFQKKKKYLEVIIEFKTENNTQNLVGNAFVFLLTLGSILSVIFFGILLTNNR